MQKLLEINRLLKLKVRIFPEKDNLSKEELSKKSYWFGLKMDVKLKTSQKGENTISWYP